MAKTIAVIGAGPAGLAAALELARAGVKVVLYERASRAGGKLRTQVMGGAHVDVGIQMVSTTHSTLFEVAERAGAGALLQRSAGRDAVWRKGKPQGITYGSVSSMATSGALPTTLKLKLAARYLPYLTAHADDLDANDPAANGGASQDVESIGAWGRREMGDDFVELLAYPPLAAYYGASPEDTSAVVYHALAKVGMDVIVYAVRGGFGALADAVVAAVQERGGRLLVETEVRAVATRGARVHVDAGAASAEYDGVVVAVPGNRAGALVSAEPHLAARLAALQVAVRPGLTVALRLDGTFPGDWFGLSFPRVSDIGDRVAAVCVQSRKLPDLVPAGGDALVILPAPAAVPALMPQSGEAVTKALLGALEQEFRGITKQVRSAHVQRFADGYTVFGPGVLKRIAADRTRAAADRGGRVVLAGEYLMAPSAEGAARTGVRAARTLLQQISEADG